MYSTVWYFLCRLFPHKQCKKSKRNNTSKNFKSLKFICFCTGLCCAGPCSVTSTRRGDIFQRHDCALLFYDVNTDVIHWTLRHDGDWRTTIEKNRFTLLVQLRRPVFPVHTRIRMQMFNVQPKTDRKSV